MTFGIRLGSSSGDSAEPITDPGQLTPDRLTTILRQNRMLEWGEVVRVQTVPWKSQQVSYLVKVTVEYSRTAEPLLPTDLILKYSRSHQPTRRSITLTEREHRFYRDIAPAMSNPPVPLCLDSKIDRESGRAHLILDDLSKSHRNTDFPLPPSLADAEGIVDCLADLHAQWWNNRALGTTIGTRKDAKWIDRRVTSLASTVERFLTRFGKNLSVEVGTAIEEAMAHHRQVLGAQAARDLTITHGDAHANNFLISREPAEAKAIALDWEFWDIEPGVNDLATFIAQNWYPDLRREREHALVERYRVALSTRGVDIPSDRMWFAYRVAIAKHVLTPVKQQANGISARAWWPNLQRIVGAYTDLECRAVLSEI